MLSSLSTKRDVYELHVNYHIK